MPTSYNLFIPRAYKVMVVDIGIDEHSTADYTAPRLDGGYTGDLSVFQDNDNLILTVSKPIKWKEEPGIPFEKIEPWIDVAYSDYLKAVKDLDVLGIKQLNKMKKFYKDGNVIADFNVFVVGVRPDYWHEATVEIDNISGEHTLEEIQSRDRFSALLKDMGVGSGISYYSDSIMARVPSELYYFPSSDTGRHKYMGTFMLSMNVDTSRLHNRSSMDEIKDLSQKLMRNLSLVVSQYMRIVNLQRTSYELSFKRAEDIKKKALDLRKQVSSLLSHRNTKYTLTDEEKMLKDTAVYFARCTDILYGLSDTLSLLESYERRLHTHMHALGISGATDKDIFFKQPLQDYVTTRVKTVVSSFQSLVNDLHNSESSMRNSLNLLKTYMESEQRATAARSGRAVNLLTIIFAAYGITDTISNFVVYYLQDRYMTGFSVGLTLLLFLLTMIFPTLLLVFAYFFYLRRKW